jgi:hypothetical protein
MALRDPSIAAAADLINSRQGRGAASPPRPIRDQRFLVATTSRYSLGMTSVPSLATLNSPISR